MINVPLQREREHKSEREEVPFKIAVDPEAK
jgi:hypothetical protein